MVDHPTNSDPYAALAHEDPSQLIEFIEQLQNAVDGAEVTNSRLAKRIEKLVTDRETLQRRLVDARQQLASIRSHPLGRIVSRSIRSETASDEPSQDNESAPSAVSDGGLRVATILDVISDACWTPEFHNIRLSRNSWHEQIESSAPDLLFVESAFAGIDGSWTRRVAHFGEPHGDLSQLVSACRDLGIPTVFWNKEDPVNYSWFIGAASLFDHVFTVDGDQISRYRQHLGHDRVHVLPFAAQPRLHFPPSSDEERSGSVAFAGSYYARKHSERREQMEMLLTPALDYGLEIYDRMDRSEDPRFLWPDQFRSRIVGSVPYAEMGAVYRRYKVFLNVNTVTDSPTMCARRVFELAAAGTPIVSGPSKAIERLVPREIVDIVNSSEHAESAMRRLLEVHSSSPNTAGLSWIADGQTYEDRFQTVVEVLS